MIDISDCRCWKCLKNDGSDQKITVIGDIAFKGFVGMVLCSICGNKRCPYANDHNNACTNSNESGQKGSAYE
jgi:hypothetical protein